ncbi:efflux RND transporter periplasmic adaptor subunit, partial [Enterococcus faecalis]|uniref:efflux RND transporter periplasmic adaptor subunit n=1 Tax=Enterococcus faecalis TaxID=1351 RepID=UPI00403F5E18
DVPQALSGSIGVGAPVLLRTDAGERNAEITSIFPSVDPQTRTFRVEALLSNADGTLKPGMFAHLEIRGSGHQELAVRTAAVQEGDTGKYV